MTQSNQPTAHRESTNPWAVIDELRRQLAEKEKEIATLRELATAAAAFCDETAGLEVTENGKRLNELVAQWRNAQ